MDSSADYGLMSIGAAATTALDLMEEELKEAQHAEDMRVFKLMAENRLTPEEAMMAFARKQAYFLTHARLLGKVTQGRNAARRVKLAEETNG